jgi:hypothetical protein
VPVALLIGAIAAARGFAVLFFDREIDDPVWRGLRASGQGFGTLAVGLRHPRPAASAASGLSWVAARRSSADLRIVAGRFAFAVSMSPSRHQGHHGASRLGERKSKVSTLRA